VRTIARGGDYLRVADPDWYDPLDGGFAALRGGRWNPAGSFPVVYLCRSLAVARANVARRLAGQPFGPEDLDPSSGPVLVTARVGEGRFADVVTDRGCRAVGLPSTYPLDSRGRVVGWERCQPIGLAAFDAGLPGLACRSAATARAVGAEELAWFQRGRRRLRRIRMRRFDDWFWAGD
jgi:hypothetical protein